MSERIVYAIEKNIMVYDQNRFRRLSSEFIEQYCRNHEQVTRKRAWKHDGFGARFRLDMFPGMGMRETSIENALITGLTSGGANPSKTKPAEKELFIEGERIDAAKSFKANRKAGESLPGIIPQKWELIRQDTTGEITVMARGVCSFAVLSRDEFVYSNGRHIFKMSNGKRDKLADADMPQRIVVLH